MIRRRGRFYPTGIAGGSDIGSQAKERRLHVTNLRENLKDQNEPWPFWRHGFPLVESMPPDGIAPYVKQKRKE